MCPGLSGNALELGLFFYLITVLGWIVNCTFLLGVVVKCVEPHCLSQYPGADVSWWRDLGHPLCSLVASFLKCVHNKSTFRVAS